MLFLKMFKSLHLFPILPVKSKEMSGGSFAHYCIFISCAISLPAYYDQTLNGVHYHECVLRSAACIRVRRCLSSSTNFPHHRDHYQTSVTPITITIWSILALFSSTSLSAPPLQSEEDSLSEAAGEHVSRTVDVKWQKLHVFIGYLSRGMCCSRFKLFIEPFTDASEQSGGKEMVLPGITYEAPSYLPLPSFFARPTFSPHLYPPSS